MSDFRSRMRRAEACKQAMVGDRASGESQFDEFLREHPSDGMIYLKRGEAWEFHRELQRAVEDYDRAAALLPMKDWSDRARSAADRIRPLVSPLESRSIGHREMSSIYHELNILLDHVDPDGSGEDLAPRTSRLDRAGVIPPSTATQIHSLRISRNNAVHQKVVFEGADADAILAGWKAVAAWATAQGCDLGDPFL